MGMRKEHVRATYLVLFLLLRVRLFLRCCKAICLLCRKGDKATRTRPGQFVLPTKQNPQNNSTVGTATINNEHSTDRDFSLLVLVSANVQAHGIKLGPAASLNFNNAAPATDKGSCC